MLQPAQTSTVNRPNLELVSLKINVNLIVMEHVKIKKNLLNSILEKESMEIGLS